MTGHGYLGTDMDFFGYLIIPVIGGCIVYWIIRSAVFGAMRDFEKWKYKQYGVPDGYDYERP